jgi:hypothetical protein
MLNPGILPRLGSFCFYLLNPGICAKTLVRFDVR